MVYHRCMKSIIFATTNSGKVHSLRRALDSVGLSGLSINTRELAIIEPQADTCEEVALSKARQAYELVHEPVLVDDSSFHITALGGFPGVYAKYMNETLGAAGIVDFMRGKDDRSAHFDGVLVYVDGAGERHVFHDDLYHGVIADSVHTMDDARAWSDLHKIFIPRGSQLVIGEMDEDEYASQVTERNSKYQRFVEWMKNETT